MRYGAQVLKLTWWRAAAVQFQESLDFFTREGRHIEGNGIVVDCCISSPSCKDK
jgi:hypothetical protein